MALAAKQNHDLPQVIRDQMDKLDHDITALKTEVKDSNRRFTMGHPNLKWLLLVVASAASVLGAVVGVSVAISH